MSFNIYVIKSSLNSIAWIVYTIQDIKHIINIIILNLIELRTKKTVDSTVIQPKTRFYLLFNNFLDH